MLQILNKLNLHCHLTNIKKTHMHSSWSIPGTLWGSKWKNYKAARVHVWLFQALPAFCLRNWCSFIPGLVLAGGCFLSSFLWYGIFFLFKGTWLRTWNPGLWKVSLELSGNIPWIQCVHSSQWLSFLTFI